MKTNFEHSFSAKATPRQLLHQSRDEIMPQKQKKSRDTVDILFPATKKTQVVKEELTWLQSEIQRLLEELENSRNQADADAKAARIRIKCFIIAARIMRGDKVSQTDKNFLAKHDVGLYARALAMRIEKENPKKYKSISEDEEDEIPQTDSPGGAQQSEGEESNFVDISATEMLAAE